MSGTVRTYVLYGTEVDVSKYDGTRFESKQDFVEYLYDVINKEDSPFEFIFNSVTGRFYFGFVVDMASDSNWETEYLKSQTFNEITSGITTEVKQALDWMLLIHFGTRSAETKVGCRILTVYC